MSSKILLLEDDALLNESLSELLEEEGYSVDSALNGEEALSFSYERAYDLYLLDINVPLVDGLEFLRLLRESGDKTYAIYLTSYFDRAKLKEAFSIGGDDYIIKPFDNDELLLRIAAKLRRQEVDNSITFGELSLDERHKQITFNGIALELSQKEYALLKLLLLHVKKNVTKEMITDTLWQGSQEVSDGSIRVYINRIKKMIAPYKIENIRGIGYRLVH